jgi:hypothetical protein
VSSVVQIDARNDVQSSFKTESDLAITVDIADRYKTSCAAANDASIVIQTSATHRSRPNVTLELTQTEFPSILHCRLYCYVPACRTIVQFWPTNLTNRLSIVERRYD